MEGEEEMERWRVEPAEEGRERGLRGDISCLTKENDIE